MLIFCYFPYLVDHSFRLFTVLGVRILGDEIVVFVLCIPGAFHFLVLERVDHLLILGLHDKPTELLRIQVARIVLKGILGGDFATQLIIAQIRAEVVIELCAFQLFER